MNQESELADQLMCEGFTPFGDIEDLSMEQLLDKSIFEYVFSIENEFDKENIIIALQVQAKKLKVSREFSKKLKLYREQYIKNIKSMNKNKTNFTNCPCDQLVCGNWIADDTGIFKRDIGNQGQMIKVKASPIPVLITERLINIDTNTEKVKLTFFKDGKWQDIIVEKNTISSKNKILQLANRGIEVTEDNAKNLITYLADLLELNNIPMKKGVSHLGWVENEFVPYTDEYSLDVDQEFKAKIKCITENGDYEEWKKYIKNLRSKSIALRFYIASSFSAPLTKLFKINSFIVHLWGKSGNGKTVAEMICASIWGKPTLGGLISNLSNTAIANERLCNFYKNIPIFLDELQIAKVRFKNFDDLIYALTEGNGKSRGNIDDGIRKDTSWNTIFLLNGEEPITSDISKEGIKNRVIEINEDDPIIDDGNAVVSFIQKNYGFAGKEFIEKIKQIENLEEIYDKLREVISKKTEYKKQINAFALIMTADYIISKEIFNDNPLTIAEISEYFRNDTDEVERYHSMILDWFAENRNKFIKDDNSATESNKNYGEIYGKYEILNGEITNLYIIPKAIKDYLNENNINFDSIKKKLFERGYIEKSSEGKYQIITRIDGVLSRCIKMKISKCDSNIDYQVDLEDLPF